MELVKLKVKSVKKLGITRVNDLTVADTQHYITENGVINHNTGPEYAASIILFLGKSQLIDGSGKNKVKSGIIVKIAPNKNRFSKPNVVTTFIRYDSGMNPFVGLEQHLDWDSVGVDKGVIDKNGDIIITKKAKTWVSKNLDYPIETASQLYSPKVFTSDVLKAIDEHIKPIFSYNINDEIPDEMLSEEDIDIFSEEIDNALDAVDEV